MSNAYSAAIRDALNSQPVIMGQWSAVSAQHNGATAQMLCKQDRIGRNAGPGSLDILIIKPGRLLNDMPVEAMLYVYRMSSKNEVTSQGIGTPASTEATLLWLTRGLPVVPHMKLSLDDALTVRRYLPSESAPADISSAAVDQALNHPLRLVLETSIRPSGKPSHALCVAGTEGDVLKVHCGNYLPTPEQLPAKLASAVAASKALRAEAGANEDQRQQPIHPAPALGAMREKVCTVAEVTALSEYQHSLFDDTECDDTVSVTTHRGLRMR